MKKYLINSLLMLLCLVFTLSRVWAENVDWKQIEKKAKGQNVYFHAWGGSQAINRYLNWASQELKREYGLNLHHVKIADTSEVVSRLLAEKIAAKSTKGSVDLVWINGENFKSFKDNNMLFGPFVEHLPNWQWVDKTLPVTVDFSESTDGLEAPWGIGQLVFIHDKKTVKKPPTSFDSMLSYAKANPYKLTYPKPPEFHGVSFLKALLIELNDNDPRLQRPADDKSYKDLTSPMWEYLDEFHQYAWRKGKQFPAGTAETLQLLDDGQIDLAISFNPNAVFAAQASGQLAASTAVYTLEKGALSNIHFLAIPWNASAKEGAMLAINFLLSPQAQSRKGNVEVWGDPSVLQTKYLSGTAKKYAQFISLAEPHPSWQLKIEKDWLQRYGS